jgi:predicted  nucleic acid-binding Zn-ribbon protein
MSRPTLHTCPKCGKRLFLRTPSGISSSGIATGGEVPAAVLEELYECPTGQHGWFTEEQLREEGTWDEEELAP